MAIKFLNTVAVDTNVLYVDASSNEVGINTQNPSRALHVKSSDQEVTTFQSTDANKSMITLQNAASSNSIARFYIQDGRILLGEDNTANSRNNIKLQKQTTRTYVDAHLNLGGTGVSARDKFGLQFRYDTADDDSYNGLTIGGTITGTTALTSDRTVSGINVDMDSTATGGNTSQELTLKGVNIDVNNKTSGDANHVYGVFASAKNNRTGTGDNMTTVHGGYFQGYTSAETGQVTSIYGLEAVSFVEDATHTVNNVYGINARATIDDSFDDTITTKIVGGQFQGQVQSGNDGQVPQSVGVYAENDIASNITNIKGVEIIADINGGTTTNSYLIKGDVQIAGSAAITNNWGLHLDDVEKNYIDGTLGINNSNPTAQLVVRNSGSSNSVLKLEDSGGTQLLSVFEDSSGNAETSMRDGTGAMTIKFDTSGYSYINGGNVGIGTETPSEKLVVSEDRSGSNASDQTKYTLVSRSTISSGTPGTGGIKVAYNDGSNEHAFGLVAGSTSADFLTSGPMHWYTNSDLNTHNATGFAMTIDTNQRVGIGTTSPITDLHVEGNALVTSNATVRGDLIIDKNPSSYPSAKLQFLRNGSTSPAMGEIIMNDNPGHQGMYMYARRSSSPYTTSYIELPTSTNYDFEINLLGTNVLTIDSSSGYTGIGTTNPSAKLQVGDGTADTRVRAYYSDSSYAELTGFPSIQLIRVLELIIVIVHMLN